MKGWKSVGSREEIAAANGGLIVAPSTAPATIDPDYPDEWLLLVTNTLQVPVTVQHLERVAQIVFARVIVAEDAADTARRTGGVGSTGTGTEG